ncbi:MAG: hypothetical protein IPH12_21110 [Saprospirales bacterium]|nr:hypothetical protein [Saprospirales bacterium]MBK8922045.1 hypothetical protein [Saprospirales bacterium]
MKYIFFLALGFPLISACTDTPSARKRTAECYVRYLASEGQFRAEVTLREARGPQAELEAIEAPEGVRYNGTLMPAVYGKGVRYQLEQPAGYHNRHTFSWKYGEQAFSFPVDLPAITSFSFGPGRLSRQRPDTLRWNGAPLEQGESIVLLWESTGGSLTVPMEISGIPGQKTIEFPAAKLAALAPGTWTLYLVRKKRVKAEQNGAILYGLAEYFTASDTLKVE